MIMCVVGCAHRASAASLVLEHVESDSSKLPDTAVQELPLRLQAFKLHLVIVPNLFYMHDICTYVCGEKGKMASATLSRYT